MLSLHDCLLSANIDSGQAGLNYCTHLKTTRACNRLSDKNFVAVIVVIVIVIVVAEDTTIASYTTHSLCVVR